MYEKIWGGNKAQIELIASIQNIEMDIFKKLKITLQPIMDQLQKIQTLLQQVNHKVELAFSLTESLQEETDQLRQALMELKDKTIMTETLLKPNRPKFRGLSERKLTRSDNSYELLVSFNTGAEEGVAPIIVKAYRFGAPNYSRRKVSSNIVVVFGDEKHKRKVLEIVRTKGTVQYQNKEITVFHGILCEVIQILKALKQTMQTLREIT